MRPLIALAATLVLAACAPVQTLSTPAPAPAPGYGQGPYAHYASREGTQIDFQAFPDDEIPINYAVYRFKSWSDAGTFARITAWNNLDRPVCVQVTWSHRIPNMTMSGGAVVLPPRASNFVIAFWITRFVVDTRPGFDTRTWSAPNLGRPVTDIDCAQARPS